MPFTSFAACCACGPSCSCWLIEPFFGTCPAAPANTEPPCRGRGCPNAGCASWVLPPAPSGSDGRRVLADVSMTEACKLDKIGWTSDSSGAKAVHRVQVRQPGSRYPLDSPPANAPSPRVVTGSPVPGPRTLPPRASRMVPDSDRTLDDPSRTWSIGIFVPLPPAPVQRPSPPSGGSAFARLQALCHHRAIQGLQFPGPVGGYDAAPLIEPWCVNLLPYRPTGTPSFHPGGREFARRVPPCASIS